MDDTWRSSIRTLSMVIGMVLAALLVGAGPEGTSPVGPLLFSDVTVALLSLLAISVAVVVAMIAFRFGDPGGGLFAFGIVVWAAGRHLAPSIDRFFAPTSGGVLLDGVFLSIALFGVVRVMERFTGEACQPQPPDQGVSDRLSLGWLAMVVALPVAHLTVVTNDPGQSAGGAALGGLAAGFLARLVAPHAPPFRLLLALVPIGVLGRILLASELVDPETSRLALIPLFVGPESWRLGGGPGLLGPLPVDWAGAGVAGFALGCSWARSFLKPIPDAQNVASNALSG